MWLSAAVAHLLQGSVCCAFNDALLHILVVTSTVAFLSARNSLPILLYFQPDAHWMFYREWFKKAKVFQKTADASRKVVSHILSLSLTPATVPRSKLLKSTLFPFLILNLSLLFLHA